MCAQRTRLEWVDCHRKPERSFFWKGKQFPFCARCTGIHLGYIFLPLFAFKIIELDIWIALLLVLPTMLDGLTQAFWERESNNIIRVTTGLAAGIGLMAITAALGHLIGNQILLLINLK